MKKTFVLFLVTLLIMNSFASAGFWDDLTGNAIFSKFFGKKKTEAPAATAPAISSIEEVTRNKEKTFQKPIDLNRLQILDYKQNPAYANLKEKDWATVYRRPGIFRTEEEKEEVETAIKVYPYPIIKAKAGYELPKTIGKKAEFITIARQEIARRSTLPQQIGLKGMGVISSVDYSKEDNNKLLAVVSEGGLFQSTNGGSTWTHLKNTPYYALNRVVIDPDDDSHFFISAIGHELYETTDNGLTWALKASLEDYCSTFGGGNDLSYWGDNNIFFKCQKGIAVSNDDGATWRELEFPFDESSSYFLNAKIKNSGKGLVAVYDSSESQNNALFYTEDGGITWENIIDGTDLGDGDYISAYDLYEDGSYIVALVENRESPVPRRIAKSYNMGESWAFTNVESSRSYGFDGDSPFSLNLDSPFSGGGQDLILKEGSPNYIAVFGYMLGLTESTDGGTNFIERKVSHENLLTLPIAKNIRGEAFELIITPLDLRFQYMIRSGNLIYLPTDQGLFSFNTATKHLKNLMIDAYVSDSIGVHVTSCPRIYTGLWHAGLYWVNPDGSIEGLPGENAGSIPGKYNGCGTEAFSSNSYLINGTTQQGVVAGEDSMRDDTGVLIDYHDLIRYTTSLTFYDGWYYFSYYSLRETSKLALYRIKFEKRAGDEVLYEYTIEPVDGPWVNMRGFNVDKKSARPYRVFDADYSTIKVWSSRDTINWNLDKDLSFLVREPEFAGGGYREIVSSGKLYTDGTDMIFSSSKGLFISNNYGTNWMLRFPNSRVSNIVKDDCGWIYAGIFPSIDMSGVADKTQLFGLWLSKDGGNTWEQNANMRKVSITKLDISPDKNYVYAATRGTGLWKVPVDCDSPPPTACISYEDCQTGYACIEGYCKVRCEINADCWIGYTCVTGGACKLKNNARCESNDACASNYCKKVPSTARWGLCIEITAAASPHVERQTLTDASAKTEVSSTKTRTVGNLLPRLTGRFFALFE